MRDITKYDPDDDMTMVVNHLVYDAFGRVTSESNSAVDSLFLFTGRTFDTDTGLQNNLHRWYDPAVGRWLSEDPIRFDGGVNLYRYAVNLPTQFIDPRGTVPVLAPECCDPAQLDKLYRDLFRAEFAAKKAAEELRQLLHELNVKAAGPRGIGLDWPAAYQFSNPRLVQLRRALDRWFATPVGQPTPGGYRRVGVIDWDTLYTVVESVEKLAKSFDGVIKVQCRSSCTTGLVAYTPNGPLDYITGAAWTIQFCLAYFEKSDQQRAGFFLHEMTHLHLGTSDHGYLGAPGDERFAPQYWNSSWLRGEYDVFLTSSELVRNAATYQGFFESLYLSRFL